MLGSSPTRRQIISTVLVSVLSLFLISCSNDDGGVTQSDVGETQDTVDTSRDAEDNASTDQLPTMSDDELSVALESLSEITAEASSICELMEATFHTALISEPQTEEQAQLMLDFYIATYGRMADVIDDETHGAALRNMVSSLETSLSGSGEVLESITSNTQVPGLETPEAIAAMEYVGLQAAQCSFEAVNDPSAGGTE